MLHYLKIGNGPNTMIAFHGLGRDATMYRNYESLFPSYTIYSIALYYHESTWEYQGYRMDEQLWAHIFEQFLQEHGICRFSLLGFSLGGKVALYTYQLFGHLVDGLHLIAPYGIKQSMAEHLVQKLPFVYRKLEKYVHQPAFFMKLLDTFQRYRLINPTILEITRKQMDTWESRYRIYYTMLLYGAIRLDLEEIKQQLENSGIPVTFYLGSYDQILTFRALYKLVHTLQNLSLHVLPGGHSAMPDKVENKLAEKPAYTTPFKWDEADYLLLIQSLN